MPAFYNLAECARLLREPRETVREWTLKGLAPTRRVGQRSAKAMPKLIKAYEAAGVGYWTVNANGSLNQLSVERLLGGHLQIPGFVVVGAGLSLAYKPARNLPWARVWAPPLPATCAMEEIDGRA